MFEGKLIIITAPSGAGKTTITHYLLNNMPSLAFSVSATTREIRKNEINGVDYYFMSTQDFKEKIQAGELLEWQEVYAGKFYGTLKSEVSRLWAAGKHVVFDVDVKGASNLKNMYGNHALSIFIKPPSLEILINRLTGRNTETANTLATRIERVRLEMTYEDAFDKVIINDDLTKACFEAQNMVSAFLNP
jgi:guanylate kinase